MCRRYDSVSPSRTEQLTRIPRWDITRCATQHNHYCGGEGAALRTAARSGCACARSSREARRGGKKLPDPFLKMPRTFSLPRCLDPKTHGGKSWSNWPRFAQPL